MRGSILALLLVLDCAPLGNLLLSNGLIRHGWLRRALVEACLLIGLGRTCCPHAFNNHFIVAFANILGTLIGRYLPLLLVKLVNVASCNHLLASTQILDVAATLARLLPLLLAASVVAIFL